MPLSPAPAAPLPALDPVALEALLEPLAERIALKLAARLRADDRLIDLAELSTRTGLGKRTITGLIARKEFPAPLRLGGTNRWCWPAVVRFLEARQGRRPRRGRGIRRPAPSTRPEGTP